MKKQQGFTLIELIVVIVILGILAVTAAPKFLNIQGDARLSTLQGLQGAINGANTILYGKAAVQGKEAAATETVEDVPVVYGYMAATKAAISAGVNLTATEWVWDDTTTAGVVVIWPEGQASTSNCKITYTDAADKNTPPTVILGNAGTISAADCN